MGIGESLILFFENFEGMGRGMGIRQNFAHERNFFCGTASESERQFVSKNLYFFRCSSLSKMSVFFQENHDELRPHPFPPSLQCTPNFSHSVSRSLLVAGKMVMIETYFRHCVSRSQCQPLFFWRLNRDWVIYRCPVLSLSHPPPSTPNPQP